MIERRARSKIEAQSREINLTKTLCRISCLVSSCAWWISGAISGIGVYRVRLALI
ncbi:hypothetical protein MtrunA17_Chr1g0180061 [Medicago truncatula]|uniref:Uncharacterized protein n=1 Tax=Medicago truncatula TaxID=3880 RepID=A0A396JN35_MEDTR|nr:hypothetical protein MtrunA17_Chr1g0180061 [Medicago truncatula]